eukprot:c6255_g1_i1.p1 GENE.c6255_g1_i1~~c6255_g1_i1.p1  ORF type:complete len:240 (+),score=28.77 c6255_g1_i1:308-1027(+)
MRKHARIHSKHRPFTCEYSSCGKSYSDKSALTKHIRSHTGERPYVCQHEQEGKICGKAFTLAAHLTRHTLIHTGEKIHVCGVDGCERRFSRVDELKTHVRTHTGERPYMCDALGCNKAFTQASALARHRRSQHTNFQVENATYPNANSQDHHDHHPDTTVFALQARLEMEPLLPEQSEAPVGNRQFVITPTNPETVCSWQHLAVDVGANHIIPQSSLHHPQSYVPHLISDLMMPSEKIG